MRHASLIAALLLALAGNAQAESFTYHGQLDDGGEPASGSYRIRLTLYAEPAGREPLAGPLVIEQVAVVDGRFAVGVEFPPLPADAATGWLEVALMAEDDVDFWSLPGRQAVELQAQLCPQSWALAGNASTNPAVDFVGTTDDRPLVLRTRNAQSLRLEPSSVLYDGLPITANVIAGSRANTVAAGVRGATIAGGGMPAGNSDPNVGFDNPNHVGGHYGTVGGGYANRVGDVAGTPFIGAVSTISGGLRNSALAAGSTVGGGASNSASGMTSTVGGGEYNVAAEWGSTVPGGSENCAGGWNSFAAGLRAKVRPATDPGDGACAGLSYPGGAGDSGTFVWADSQGLDFVSTGPNQFLVRATGGMGLNGPPINSAVEFTVVADSDGPDQANVFLRQRDFNAGVLVTAAGATSNVANNAAFYLDQYNGTGQIRRLTLAANGDLSVTAAAFKPGGGSWSAASDARLKHGIAPLSGALDRLLQLHGVSFEYREPDPARRPAGRRVGFVAQQVQPLFPDWVGHDEQGYLTVGSQGFEALAVEALRDLRAEQDAALARLEGENAALRGELAALREQQAALHDQLATLRTLLLPRVAGETR